MRFERLVIVSGKTNDNNDLNFVFDIVADNDSISEFVNGYSNWEGKRSIDGFTVEWNNTETGEKLNAWGNTRKEAIKEAVYREYGRYSRKYNEVKYTLEKI